mmetsp:Transcript_15374/g.36669  ORF Transcript_15374/g.36669 Transcript_15374/m.36669 type:complete len:218 (-) Transcript_15374:198-851(-)
MYHVFLLFHPGFAFNTARSTSRYLHVGYVICRYLCQVASKTKEINDGIEGPLRLRRRCAPTASIATANDNILVGNKSCIAIDVRYLFQIQQKPIIGPRPVLSKVELRRQDVSFAAVLIVGGKPYLEMDVGRTVRERCWFERHEFKAAVFSDCRSTKVLKGGIDVVGICRIGVIVQPRVGMSLPDLYENSWDGIALLIEDLPRDDQGSALCGISVCAD